MGQNASESTAKVVRKIAYSPCVHMGVGPGPAPLTWQRTVFLWGAEWFLKYFIYVCVRESMFQGLNPGPSLQ